MRFAAVVMGAIGVALLAGGGWWYAVTWRFAHSDAYALDNLVSVGGQIADGSGIFTPAGLLLALGLFFLRFAFNLWRDKP